MKRVYVETYGCQMNISDGELMEGVLEAQGRRGLTGDYLRVDVKGAGVEDCGRLHSGVLRGTGDELYIELSAAHTPVKAASGMESPSCSHVSSA